VRDSKVTQKGGFCHLRICSASLSETREAETSQRDGPLPSGLLRYVLVTANYRLELIGAVFNFRGSI
jgi:hypothetical protein